MVSEEKIRKVAEMKEKMEKYRVVGILNMHDLPSKQLQLMRKKLRERAEICMSKKSLIKRALDKAEKDRVEKLNNYLNIVPSLLFTNENPFKLYTYLKKNKSPAKGKAGDITSKDITINKGPTSLPPGPAISQLQNIGLQTKVKDGKINIINDKKILKKGEEISEELANVFNMLDIKPVEVGLNLVAAYEEGTIYEQDILNIDVEEYTNKIYNASNNSIALSLSIGYITSENIKPALQLAFNKSKTLSIEGNLFNFINESILICVNKAKCLEKIIN